MSHHPVAHLSRPIRVRRTWWTALAGLAVCAGVAGAGTAVAASGAGPTAPAPDTIVEVGGDAANGFDIHHYDGTVEYPPTDSEAIAECGEYNTMRQRVRCRAEVRTWYRDLADLRQSLEWAHAQSAA